ncbi:hypothetical protein FGU46_10360 [Methanobacterium sp. CWC-01]|uniref:hypothetical protein n=1 Tax=Methanobacterium aridiramus TaxID=2584467 RepID=UPI002576F4BF|nr:hypothetical protein [Methanobacterium sp. CWC-01]WJI10462.1 hypothetical protein FGU46_10360 [Methanobacterium sp. CWC-01]
MPKRFTINRSDRKIYENLRKAKKSPLKDMHNPDLFMLSMTLGLFFAKEGKELDSHDQFINDYNLSKEQRSIVDAIAVYKEQSLEVLIDEDKVIKIAEEYANAGLPILEKMAYCPDPKFIKFLEKELVDYFEKERLGSATSENIINRA